MKSIKTIIIIFLLPFFFLSCKKFLKEDVYTEFDEDEYLKEPSGIINLLYAGYNNVAMTGPGSRQKMWLFNLPGDIFFEFGGGLESSARLYSEFSWDPQQSYLNDEWGHFYQGIRNANLVLRNMDKSPLSENDKSIVKGEAHFVRGYGYYQLWLLFGPVPLIKSTDSINLEPERPNENEFFNFVESELLKAVDLCPKEEILSGRATKGAALGILSEFYLNFKKWEKCANTCQDIIDLNMYHLYEGSIKEQFSVQNDRSKSVIFNSPALPNHNPNVYMGHAFPINYPILTTQHNYGANFVIFPEWFYTFNPDDKRLDWFITSFTDVNGEFHDLLDPDDQNRGPRCFKYQPDPDAIGADMGNDIPVIRYAEILLNRAEALNELDSGPPSQECLNLINEIRVRAGINNYEISDFTDRESFRDAILQERGWEFCVEGKRRMDLVRHGKLIEKAINRGVDAKSHMTLYPIPQNEIDINPNLEQNPGYN